MKSFVRTGIAFAAGAVAGVIAGVLLAPGAGTETRNKLKKRAKKLEKDLYEMTGNLKASAKDVKETLVKEAEAVFS